LPRRRGPGHAQNGISGPPPAIPVGGSATGFHPGFEWIDLSIAKDTHRDPVQTRGVVASEPGLYFVRLPFLYAFSSTTIQGIARDAKHVAEAVIRRRSASRDARPKRMIAGRTSTSILAAQN
jgi:putative flavoprotein involved in K+ transport